jgi:hypothetical protein
MIQAKFNLPRSRVLAGFSLVAALLTSLAIWSINGDKRAAHKQAEILLTQFIPNGKAITTEYDIWKQITDSDKLTRLELARLLQQEKYAPILLKSAELISNTVIGLDYDGEMSKLLTEQLICKNLESDLQAAIEDASFYLIPSLNPVALNSAYCARVLTDSLVVMAPDTFLQRAELLSMVLGAMPAEQARPYVAEIVSLMTTERSADIDVLFSAMQNLDSTAFAGEFTSTSNTLIDRIMQSQSPSEIATLFESINYLKYEVATEQLIPVLDAALEKLLALRDHNLTRSIYFTLMDLDVSHPDTSFGPRADYLMRGINIYGNNIEISDYSGVLRLDEQYKSGTGYEPALASALLSDIRNLDEEDYISSIRPYCLRFLEISEALSYEQFLAGAKLLTEQLHNPEFIFWRECLHDPRLLARITVDDKPAMAAIIISALEEARDNANRVADQVELLGLLGSGLSGDQIDRVANVITSIVRAEPDPYLRGKVGIAATSLGINFSEDFYRELFVIFANATPDAAGLLSSLLKKLPAAQRADLVSASLGTFFSQTEPGQLAAQVEFLVALQEWIPTEDLQHVLSSLVAAIENTQDVTVVPQLITVLDQLMRWSAGRGGNSMNIRNSLKPTLIRFISASDQKADLAGLFNAARILQLSRISAEDRAVLEAAAVRFLQQIESADALDGFLRIMMKRFKITLSPADVELLSVHFIETLAKVDTPITDYAGSIENLALYSKPGELTALLQAIRQKLDYATDAVSQNRLMSTWLAVESSSNQSLSPEQRIPLYRGVLQLPWITADSRSSLMEQIEKITMQDFEKDYWKFATWVQEDRLPELVPESP